jgi:hypothetical protein
MRAGVNMVHVPHRGTAAAITNLISDQVQVIFDNLSTSIEYITAGGMRALAVTTVTRSELLPNIPTVGDFLPGYEASAKTGSGRPGPRPQKLSTNSIRRLTPASLIPRSKRSSQDWEAA